MSRDPYLKKPVIVTKKKTERRCTWPSCGSRAVGYFFCAKHLPCANKIDGGYDEHEIIISHVCNERI